MITNNENLFRDSFLDGSLSGYRENNNNFYSLYPSQFVAGTKNVASGAYSTVLGGQNVKASHSGSMVLGDGNSSRLKTSSAINSLKIDFENGTTIIGDLNLNNALNVGGNIGADQISASNIQVSNNISCATANINGGSAYFYNINADELYTSYSEISTIYIADTLDTPKIYAYDIVDRSHFDKSKISFNSDNGDLNISAGRYLTIKAGNTPTSAYSPGVSGAVAFDSNYFYRHNGQNWTRTVMAIW